MDKREKEELVDLAAMEVFFEARVKPPQTDAERRAAACMEVFTLAARKANELGMPADGGRLLRLMDVIEEFFK